MDLFYLLSNISSLVNVKWYIGKDLRPLSHKSLTRVTEGVPFNDTSDFRLQIVEYGEAILGDNLLGVQVGNEPDLYSAYAFYPTIPARHSPAMFQSPAPQL
jgi:hypothetical protein